MLASADKAYLTKELILRRRFCLWRIGIEVPLAYRTADHLRWQEMDFVVGIEIKLSNNHTLLGADGKPHVFTDICDRLAGRYPKDFKFAGWHPHCRCHAETILKTEEEIDAATQRILDGEEPSEESVNTVTDVPQAFKDWVDDNEERFSAASSVPYFITDNPQYSGVQPQRYGAVGTLTGTKLGRAATRIAYKEYENMPAPTLTPDVQKNIQDIAAAFGIKTKVKPMTFLEANYGQANVSYGKRREFRENCQSCVVVHEARLRGLNVTALGYDYSETSVFNELGAHFENVWEHPKTGKTPSPTIIQAETFDKMLNKLEKCTKAQGRYHIGIKTTNDMGHVITAERLQNGTIIYYDAQNGAFIKVEEYMKEKVEYLEVLKVDELLIRKDKFAKIARLL